MKINHTVTNRFIRYVKIDTQSNPHSTSFPSTEKQKDLGRLLVEELKEIGIPDAHLDEFGYIYATIPSTTDKEVPVLCFCSHMDTSPDCTGKDVKPIIHKNYDGKSDIILPDDTAQVLTVANHPHLADQKGHDVITASGTTLLGADNKAGIAEIMDAAQHLINHPEIKHGKIRILFTPDEEVGHGVDHVNIEKLGATVGYTVDGEQRGSIEDETFSANGATIKIEGVSIHPGFAKGKLESALKAAGEILASLPKDRLSPETTEKKEGFIHPVSCTGIADNARIDFIIRDFTDDKLADHQNELKDIMDAVMKNYPNSKAELIITEQYRNMKKVLDLNPGIVDNALEAIKRIGLEPIKGSIRGGTDGSRLSFMGLPCPNIFAGEHAFHGKHEWISVQDMEKAVEMIIEICKVWEEQA